MQSDTSEAALETVLQECGNVESFLDTFFNFMARRTDFFLECPAEGGRFGFPKGHAEALVRGKFLKWQAHVADNSNPFEAIRRTTTESNTSSSTAKTVVPSIQAPNNSSKSFTPQVRQVAPKCGESEAEHEAYNGRVTEKYSWSQNINEVDVKVPVGLEIIKGKQVKVTIETTKLVVVLAGDESYPIVEGNLSFPVKKEDCYWNLVPGESIRIWLQKSQERWWQALLEGEELLDMSRIEAVRPMEELDEEEQMKLQELCWNEERKRQGLPTSEDLKMQKVLENAWNVEGSPFQGTPVDPSKIQILSQNQSTLLQQPPSASDPRN